MDSKRSFLRALISVPLAIAASKLSLYGAEKVANYYFEVRIGGKSIARIPLYVELSKWTQFEFVMVPMSKERQGFVMGGMIKKPEEGVMLTDPFIASEDELK